MTRLLPFALAAALLGDGTALAATGLAEARQAATEARAKVTALRERQTELRRELNASADRIAQKKAKAGGRVLGDAALAEELRQSQALSGVLATMAGELATAEAEATRRDLALVDALGAELARLRGEFDAAPERERRRAVLEQMRTLRAERDRLRAALPQATVPKVGEATSDDPEDLLEQADAYRDAGDKVRRQLRALQARITEARDERELERRMVELVEEESMFDESDRRFDRSGGRTAFESDGLGIPTGGAAGPPTPDVGGVSGGSSVKAPLSPGVLESAGQVTARGGDELPALEAEQQRLEAMAQELEARAAEAERRARELQ